jgi:hypothetical protein
VNLVPVRGLLLHTATVVGRFISRQSKTITPAYNVGLRYRNDAT